MEIRLARTATPNNDAVAPLNRGAGNQLRVPSPTPSAVSSAFSPTASIHGDASPAITPTVSPRSLPAASAKSGELNVQAELRAYGLDKLLSRHKLAAKRHATYNNLVLLKYAANDFDSEVMKECRGVVLDEKMDWAVVGCPFFKFMNQDERGADPIDWSRARVYEKLDGSLCMLYYYDGGWRVASSGSPDGSGNIGKQSFQQVFWDIWTNVCKYQEPQDTSVTYMFEMLSPRNQIVCGVSKERIILLGVRRLCDLCEELPEEHAARHGWEVAKSFPLSSLADVLKAAAELNGGDRQDGKVPDDEGYVVCDSGNFNRVKIKSPKYVALAHLKGAAATRSLSDAHMLPLVLSDEVEEMSAYFPHLRPRLEQLSCAVTAMAEACVTGSSDATGIAAKAPEAVRGDVSKMRAWLCVPGNVDLKKLLKLLSVGGFLPSSHGVASTNDHNAVVKGSSAKSKSKPKVKSESKVTPTQEQNATVPSQERGGKGKGKTKKIEKRPDPAAPSGKHYTRDEFIEYYGAKEGAKLWEVAAVGSSDAGTHFAGGSSDLVPGGRRRKR